MCGLVRDVVVTTLAARRIERLAALVRAGLGVHAWLQRAASMAFTMPSRILAALCAPLACWMLAAATVETQEPAGGAREALVRWLDALDETQRSRCSLALDDEARKDWNYTPRKRAGLRVGGLGELQQTRLDELLGSVLDSAALGQLQQIRELERVLFELESRPDAPASWRDFDEYYVCVFGDPRSEQPWSWRFEGHHVSLTVSAVGNTVVGVTPLFLGANPARHVAGTGGELRVLAQEEDLARGLFESLDERQRAKARLEHELTGDILGRPGSAPPEGKLGILAKDLTEEQRSRLRELVELFARRLRGSARERALAQLDRELERARFVWIGGSGPDERCYWRVNAGSAVFEFDNSQPGANHVHTLWRDSGADFGGSDLDAR